MHYKFNVCGHMHENLRTCVRLHIHPNLHSYSLCVCVWVCVCVCARTGESVSARVLCCIVCQFHFALYD